MTEILRTADASLSLRGEGHMNYRKNDRWPSYRFYSALQRQKSPMLYICKIFGAPRFLSFSTQSARNGPAGAVWRCPFMGCRLTRSTQPTVIGQPLLDNLLPMRRRTYANY